MATGVSISQSGRSPSRSSSQMINATLPETPAKYSKRGAAGDARKVDMYFLMQKFGAKREFLKDTPETLVDAKPKKTGFVVHFSLSGAYKALERQEFEASVPQLTPVRVIKKRTVLMKKRAALNSLGSVPEGSSEIVPLSGRGTPDLASVPGDGSTVVSRATTAKSKRSIAFENLKTQNQQKLLWKTLVKKAVVADPSHTTMGKSPLTPKSRTSPMLAFHNVVAQKLAEHKETQNDILEERSDEGVLPMLVSRQSSRVLTRENSQVDVDNSLGSKDVSVPAQKEKTLKESAKEKSKADKIKKLSAKGEKDKKKGCKTDKIDKSKGAISQNLGKSDQKAKSNQKLIDNQKSTSVKKLEKKMSKLDLDDNGRSVSSKWKTKKVEAEAYEPFGSKLYQTMMQQTLGGKRPDYGDDTQSMDTLARFLTTRTNSCEEETVTASEMPPSTSSKLNQSGQHTQKRVQLTDGGNTKEGRKMSKDSSAQKKDKKVVIMSDEEKIIEQRKRKVSNYLYHMCNCRYIAKPDTLSRLYQKKQNLAGVIEIYGCPPDEDKGNSPIVCPFCTVFPRQRVHAWLEDVDDEETAPHDKKNF